jgi:hypothetical protein
LVHDAADFIKQSVATDLTNKIIGFDKLEYAVKYDPNDNKRVYIEFQVTNNFWLNPEIYEINGQLDLMKFRVTDDNGVYVNDDDGNPFCNAISPYFQWSTQYSYNNANFVAELNQMNTKYVHTFYSTSKSYAQFTWLLVPLATTVKRIVFPNHFEW